MKKVFSLLISLLIYQISFSQTAPDYERLSKACRIWGLIKYFNPYEPSGAFDSAFAAQVPDMLKSESDNDWFPIFEEWFNVLKDPANRIVSKDKFAGGVAKSEMTEDSLLIVTINGSKFFDDWEYSETLIKSVLESSKKAKGIIFDIRQYSEIPFDYEKSLNDNFEFFGVNKAFGTPEPPKIKTVYYSGFIPEKGSTSGMYFKGEILQNCIITGIENSFNIKTVWVVNKYSELPFVAISQKAAGNGFIINDNESIDQLLPVTRSLSFSENYSVKFRTADILMPENQIPPADYVYSESENLVEVAKSIISRGDANKLRSKETIYRSNNSRSYPEKKFPDLGYRVLAAAKIFTVIENFFPYYQYMDKNWDEVLLESLPFFVNAKDEIEYGLAVARMYSNIQDSHGFIRGNKGRDQLFGVAFAPFNIGWIENKAVVTSFLSDSICNSNGLKIGDIVQKVNGTNIEKLMEEKSEYFSCSTIQNFNQLVSQTCIRGKDNEEVIFTLLNNKGVNYDLELILNKSYKATYIPKFNLDTIELLNGNIGYADLTRMGAGKTDEMFEMFKNTKAIIFDMRGYPNETAWTIAPRLTNDSYVPLALFRKPEAISPNILSNWIYSTRTYTEFIQTVSPTDKWKYNGKTVMLINQDAQSQAEHTGLFFESVNKTTFIGSPTVGANGDVTNFEIPGGIVLYFSGQGVWHADGKQLQRLGLQPDVFVEPTIEGIRYGKDEVLDKAIEWININVD